MLVRANVGVLWFKVRVQGIPRTREMANGFQSPSTPPTPPSKRYANWRRGTRNIIATGISST